MSWSYYHHHYHTSSLAYHLNTIVIITMLILPSTSLPSYSLSSLHQHISHIGYNTNNLLLHCSLSKHQHQSCRFHWSSTVLYRKARSSAYHQRGRVFIISKATVITTSRGNVSRLHVRVQHNGTWGIMTAEVSSGYLRAIFKNKVMVCTTVL